MFDAIPWDGKRITKPGIYSGVSMAAYHGDITDGPSVSSSGLRKIFHESPADYFDTSYLNPDRPPEEDTDTSALIMGRAVHHLIFGEPDFQAHYAEQPKTYIGPDLKTKAMVEKPWHNGADFCKDWNARRADENRMILKPSEVEDIRGMANSLSRNEFVRTGGLSGVVERSFFWKDAKTGIWLKTRPDVIPTAAGDVTDLKTTESVQRDKVRRTIETYQYYQQAALIALGFAIVLNIPVRTFTFLFVQKKRPYSCYPYHMKDGDIIAGAVCNRAALDIMARCLKEGRWPGPGGDDEMGAHIETSLWHYNGIKLKLDLLAQANSTNYNIPERKSDYES